MSNRVKLVAITKPVIDECETAEDLVAYCARVSNPNNQSNHDTSGKLLEYCVNNSHWSIFEMVSLTMQIECTRDIGRQILRHKSFSFQEFSQRYASVECFDDELFEMRETRVQDPKNRQKSIECDDQRLINIFENTQRDIQDRAIYEYKRLLSCGVAKEQARCILPEGMTRTRMYMSGNLRSWIHYCQLRGGNGTQKEHKYIADQCKEMVIREFPALTNVLE